MFSNWKFAAVLLVALPMGANAEVNANGNGFSELTPEEATRWDVADHTNLHLAICTDKESVDQINGLPNSKFKGARITLQAIAASRSSPVHCSIAAELKPAVWDDTAGYESTLMLYRFTITEHNLLGIQVMDCADYIPVCREAKEHPKNISDVVVAPPPVPNTPTDALFSNAMFSPNPWKYNPDWMNLNLWTPKS